MPSTKCAWLVGGRFDGLTVKASKSPGAWLLMPFSLGTPNPYPDRLWLDDDGWPVDPPFPVATYAHRGLEWDELVYEFESETTAEHWTPETFTEEMAKRRELRLLIFGARRA